MNKNLQMGGAVTMRKASGDLETQMATDRPQIALCRIEHDNKVYNYGDKVPEQVVDAYPNAVGDKPYSAQEIEGLKKDELVALLKRQSGIEERPNA